MITSDPKELTVQLEKRLAEIAETQLLVGIPKEAMSTEEKGVYLADIADKNNFGSYSEHIPARPFGSTTVPVFKDKIMDFFQKEMADALKGKRAVKQAFDRVGFVVAGFMKQNLSTGKWAPNAPLTIKLKGSSKPLIDTGEMRRAITWVSKKIRGSKDV
tara:strand:- start:1679 stop:2155 length:477 start_codon:yes stop_codon:yes gene_type:complete